MSRRTEGIGIALAVAVLATFWFGRDGGSGLAWTLGMVALLVAIAVAWHYVEKLLEFLFLDRPAERFRRWRARRR